jgi:hypothetical protein
MLTTLLGLSMAVHLFAYQASEQSFDQTLVTNHVNRVVAIHWEWKENA